MAKETVNIDILIDASKSAKTLKQQRKALQELREGLDNVKHGSGAFELLTEEANRLTQSMGNLNLTFEDVYGDIKPMTGALGELEDRMYQMAYAGQQNTQEFKELQQEAIKMRKTIIDVDASVDAFADRGAKLNNVMGFVSGIAGAFTVAQGAMNLFGEESEELNEAMLRMQSLMGIVIGLNEVSKLVTEKNTIAQKLYNAALRANPIFLIIGAVTAAIAAWKLYTSVTEDNTDAEEKRAEAIKKSREETKKQRIEIAKESGEYVGLIQQLKATNKNSKERSKLIKEINEKYGTTLQNLKDEKKFQEQLNKSVEDYIKYKTIEFNLKKNQEKIDKNLATQSRLKDEIKELNKTLVVQNGLYKARTAGLKDFNAAAFKEQLGIKGTEEAIKEKEKALKSAQKRLKKYGEEALKFNSLIDGLGFSTGKAGDSVGDLGDEMKNFNELVKKANQDLQDELNFEPIYDESLADLKSYNLEYFAELDNFYLRRKEEAKTTLEEQKAEELRILEEAKIAVLGNIEEESEEGKKIITNFDTARTNILDRYKVKVDKVEDFTKKKLLRSTKDLTRILKNLQNKDEELKFEFVDRLFVALGEVNKNWISYTEGTFQTGQDYIDNIVKKYGDFGIDMAGFFDDLTNAGLEFQNTINTLDDGLSSFGVDSVKTFENSLLASEKIGEEIIATNKKSEEIDEQIRSNKQAWLQKELDLVEIVQTAKIQGVLNNLRTELEAIENSKKSEADKEKERKAARENAEKQVLIITKQGAIARSKVEERVTEQFESEQEKKKAATRDFNDFLIQGTLDAYNSINDFITDLESKRISQIEYERDKRLEAISAEEEAYNESLIQRTNAEEAKFLKEEEFKNKRREAEKKAEKEIALIRYKEEQRQYAGTLASIIQQTALAIMKAAPNVPLQIATGVLGGIQFASAAAATPEKPKFFAKGGLLDGPSHAEGGIQTQFGELEGGEAVINKQATSKYLPILDAINQSTGGSPLISNKASFTGGGVTNVNVNNSELAQMFEAYMGKPMKAYVVSNEITEAQNNESKLKDKTSF